MNNYCVNDLVVHTREGLAKIMGTTLMMDKEYYLVRLSRGTGENIYVPVDHTESIIRPVMSVVEADNLLKLVKTFEIEFNSNTKQRRDNFKKRLSSGDVKDIAYLVHQLHYYETLNEADTTVKLGPVDLDMLRFAKNILLDELAVTYGKKEDEIANFVYSRIQTL